MSAISSFDALKAHLINRKGAPKRVAVVWPEDECTRQAVKMAEETGFARAIMLDSKVCADPDAAAAQAVALVRQGQADVIMKGMINTDNLLRAILNKETGILLPGGVLTHLTVAEIPAYHKLLLLSDVAVIPYPNETQFRAMVTYMTTFARAMGITAPRIALTHCSEKVDTRHFPFTGVYETLKQEAEKGTFGACIVDGPMDVKTACDRHAQEKKHIDSPINGDADGIIFPDIEAGNTFYKTVTLFCGATMAGLLQGAQAPVVLCSRGDDADSKFNALAIACL